MYTITDTAEMTGTETHTIRYYEKIGLLPTAKRQNGKNRYYTDQDIRYLKFVLSLKQTGMSLEEIAEYVKEGCILELNVPDVQSIIENRQRILAKHLKQLEDQYRQLGEIINLTREKLITYQTMLDQKE